jgi:hypothetical protein
VRVSWFPVIHERPVIIPHLLEGPRMSFIFTAFLLVLGGILLVVGFNATESIHNEASRLVGGRYSDRTIGFIVSGSVCFMLGLVGIFLSHRA